MRLRSSSSCADFRFPSHTLGPYSVRLEQAYGLVVGGEFVPGLVRALSLTVARRFLLGAAVFVSFLLAHRSVLLQPACSAPVRFIFCLAGRSWNLSARFFSAWLGNPGSRSFYLPHVRSGVQFCRPYFRFLYSASVGLQ
jgi:hypothetical protein